MRTLTWVVCMLLLVAGCGKEASDPVPARTSPDGVWTYTTPDKSISVDFELKTSNGVLSVVSASIVVGGTPGDAAAQLTDVNLPVIGKIRVNANDADLDMPYAITFNACSIASDFNSISVADASYTYPWGQIKPLSGITITRK